MRLERHFARINWSSTSKNEKRERARKQYDGQGMRSAHVKTLYPDAGKNEAREWEPYEGHELRDSRHPKMPASKRSSRLQTKHFSSNAFQVS